MRCAAGGRGACGVRRVGVCGGRALVATIPAPIPRATAGPPTRRRSSTRFVFIAIPPDPQEISAKYQNFLSARILVLVGRKSRDLRVP